MRRATSVVARRREEDTTAFIATQSEVQKKLDAREDHASQVLQRSLKCHLARTIHKDEHFVQLEYPSRIIVGSVRTYLARRIMNYKRHVWPGVVVLKNNWRVPLARRKLQRMKYAKEFPRSYKMIAKQILKNILDEQFEPSVAKITNVWAADNIGRAWRCNRARRDFWERFDVIDELENDIGEEMTVPLLVGAMAESLKWAEKNAGAATIQSRIRVPDAITYRQEMQDYDDYVTESAVMIQCAFRSYKARFRLDTWDTPVQQANALTLQLAYRCYLHRDKYKERYREWELHSENALTIQTQCRVWLAKQRFFTRELDLLWPPAFDISSKAALTLQRVYRGHEARDSLRSYVLMQFFLSHAELEVKQRTSADRIQQAWRCHIARIDGAIALHNSYSLMLKHIRARRRAAEEPKYDQLVINDNDVVVEEDEEEEEEISDKEFQRTYSSEHIKARIAKKIQATFRAHLVRLKIKKEWGWDHVTITTAQMNQWHRKMATKKIQHFWRGYRERKRFLAARQATIDRKKAAEDEFKADPTLRRVQVLNRETRVRLTAIEESHGTQVTSFSLTSFSLPCLFCV